MISFQESREGSGSGGNIEMGRLAQSFSSDNESPRRNVRPTAPPPPPPSKQQDNNAYVMNETYEEFDTRQSTGSTSTRTFSEAQ